jgi:hypothetical protein
MAKWSFPAGRPSYRRLEDCYCFRSATKAGNYVRYQNRILTAIGRTRFYDPDWAVKVRAGRLQGQHPFERAAMQTLA